FILLAPLNGALTQSLPKRWILVGSTAFCLCITSLLAVAVNDLVESWFWWISLGLVVAGQAVYSPARYALLPAGAQDACLPLSRVMGWMEMGQASGALAGIFLVGYLQKVSWPEALAALGWEPSLETKSILGPFPVILAAATGLDLIAVLGAL